MRSFISIYCLVVGLHAFAGEPTQTASVAVQPEIPQVRSPVDLFRELLDMKPAERTNVLAKKSEAKRKVIEDQLREFDAMPLDQRQYRLRLMQLRWELNRVLESPATNRETAMVMIPEADRPLIRQRLQYWDKLSPAVQGMVLTNEMAMFYLMTGQVTGPTASTKPLPEALAASMERWRELKPDQQQKAYESFRTLFDLGRKEREKLLAEIQQRERIEKLMKSFENLPPTEREKRMKSFQRFTSMTTEQRIRFLKNAERWANMPESEKNALREMPSIPPLPPGFLPPIPTNFLIAPGTH